MFISYSMFKSVIQEAIEDELEEQIEEMQGMPEFKTVDAFIEMKLDNDDLAYSFIELQALARNTSKSRLKDKRVTEASPEDISAVRNTLEKEMGFKYVGRQPVKQTRGFKSNSHGTSPWAGTGGGGSGFGSDFHGSTFTSFGGGPGAIGGGYKWDANDPKNLGMGAKRKK